MVELGVADSRGHFDSKLHLEADGLASTSRHNAPPASAMDPLIHGVSTASEGSGNNRALTADKIQEIRQATLASLEQCVRHLQTGNVVAALSTVYEMREDLMDDLMEPPAQPSSPPT